MERCPKCGATLGPDAVKCFLCNATFGGGTATGAGKASPSNTARGRMAANAPERNQPGVTHRAPTLTRLQDNARADVWTPGPEQETARLRTLALGFGALLALAVLAMCYVALSHRPAATLAAPGNAAPVSRPEASSDGAMVAQYLAWLQDLNEQRSARARDFKQRIQATIDAGNHVLHDPPPPEVPPEAVAGYRYGQINVYINQLLGHFDQIAALCRQDLDALDAGPPPPACARLHAAYRAVCACTADGLSGIAARLHSEMTAILSGDPNQRDVADRQARSLKSSSGYDRINAQWKDRVNAFQRELSSVQNEYPTSRRDPIRLDVTL